MGQKTARARDRSDHRSAAITRSDNRGHRFEIPTKYGIKVKVHLRKDGKGHINASMPKDVLRKYLGDESCIFAIESEGKALYKWWNPRAKSIEREIPKWMGNNKDSMEMTIRKVSTLDYIKEINRRGLPFGVKIDTGGRYYIVAGSRAIPVESAGIHWEGGFGNTVYLTLNIKDVAGVEHAIKIRYNGYDPPEAVYYPRNNVRIIVNVHYIDLRDTLVVVYKLGSEGHLTHHEIRLGSLDVEKFKVYLNELGMKGKAVIDEVIGIYNNVMGYTIDDARHLNYYDKGLYGEWRVVEHDAERVQAIRYPIKYGNGKIRVDIKETDRLVDAKFWDEGTFYQLLYHGDTYHKNIDEMLRYRKAMEIANISKVYFVFIDHIRDGLFEKGKHTILKGLMDRVGYVSWIDIVNGLDKYG